VTRSSRDKRTQGRRSASFFLLSHLRVREPSAFGSHSIKGLAVDKLRCVVNSCLYSRNEKNRREVISLLDVRSRGEFFFCVVNLEFDLDVCVHLLDGIDDRAGEAGHIGEYFP